MNLEKPKIKNKEATISKWLQQRVSPLQMDMVIPHSLGTCVELLREYRHEFWDFRKTMVEFTRIDVDTYTVYIKHWRTKLDIVEAKGNLNRLEKDTTRITAEINLTQRAYRIYLLVAAVYILFLIINVPRFFPDGIIISTVLIFFHWHFIRSERHYLKRLIEDILQPDIRKKKKA